MATLPGLRRRHLRTPNKEARYGSETPMHELIFTRNACYVRYLTDTSRWATKLKGVVVHSTGANNSYLNRYVGPDDGIVGKNRFANCWNQPSVKKRAEEELDIR